MWRGECRASFGLESKTDPSGGACASFVEAARHWTDFTVRTFGASQPPAAARATLAPLWQSAREAWGCVSRWAGDALPEAKATLGPPASATEIAHSEAQRMFGEQAKPAEQPSTVITPPATQSRPQLDDEKERLRLERDAARRELEALKAQLAQQSSSA